MKLALLLATLLAACASPVHAEPAPAPPKPPTTACRATGPVLFEIDLRVDPGAELATSTTKVFATGAWTREQTTINDQPPEVASGCLPAADRKQLEAALAGATWKVTTAQIRCMAVSATFTVYQVRGKPVFTQRLCGREQLDEKSRVRLNAAVAVVETAIKAASTPAAP